MTLLLSIVCVLTSSLPSVHRIKTMKEPGIISAAIKKCVDGDTIILTPGIYKEAGILIDKKITLRGEKGAVIDGGGKGEIIRVVRSGCVIQNLEIRNTGVSHITDIAALRVEADSCLVSDNIIKDSYFGIYLSGAAASTLTGNSISGAGGRQTNLGNGIHLWNCRNILIKNNFIQNQRDGIYFEFVEESYITGNNSAGNLRYGLHFMFSNRCSYVNNTFKGNSAGVAVMYTSYVEMRGNRFTDNTGNASYGLLLKDIRNSRISGNTFDGNSVGLYSEGSASILADSNKFMKNGWAVRIMANSTEVTFTGNSFTNNSFDVSTNSVQNFNCFSGNYWDQYKGYDLDKNGRGDVPYRPVKLFSVLTESNPAALLLLRSFFCELMNLAESVMPVLTPETLVDNSPIMRYEDA